MHAPKWTAVELASLGLVRTRCRVQLRVFIWAYALLYTFAMHGVMFCHEGDVRVSSWFGLKNAVGWRSRYQLLGKPLYREATSFGGTHGYTISIHFYPFLDKATSYVEWTMHWLCSHERGMTLSKLCFGLGSPNHQLMRAASLACSSFQPSFSQGWVSNICTTGGLSWTAHLLCFICIHLLDVCFSDECLKAEWFVWLKMHIVSSIYYILSMSISWLIS